MENKLETSKKNFKVGYKVYHIQYGWGVVSERTNDSLFPIEVAFYKNKTRFTEDGKEFEDDLHGTLSFTEYTLLGFSQERPIELPEVGELCLVRDEDRDNWICRKFYNYLSGSLKPYYTDKTTGWKQIKRIKILD